MEKNIIVYFSGTGNTLHIAKHLATSMEECKILSIPQIIENPSLFEIPDRLGIMFPVHFQSVPFVVEYFITEILASKNISDLGYLYVITDSTSHVKGAVHQKCAKLLSMSGVHASYYGHVIMPQNLTSHSKEDIQKTVSAADITMNHISKDLKNENIKAPSFILLKRLTLALWTHLRNTHTNAAQYFSVDETRCNGCGRCYRTCPTNNIEMKNKSPIFLDHCIGCQSCINACPQNAILKKNKHIHQYLLNGKHFYEEYR